MVDRELLRKTFDREVERAFDDYPTHADPDRTRRLFHECWKIASHIGLYPEVIMIHADDYSTVLIYRNRDVLFGVSDDPSDPIHLLVRSKTFPSADLAGYNDIPEDVLAYIKQDM